MKKFLLISILLSFCLSCTTEKKYENDAELCELLSKMLEDDQEIRNLPEMSAPFFPILDSIIAANFSSRKEYGALPSQEQLKWGKIARAIADKLPKPSQRNVDSLWTIQKKIDLENSKLLLDITQKRGWPTKAQLKCQQSIAPVVIFRHAPKELIDEIRPVIEKEFKENRMGEGDYWFITNHLDGRPPVTFGDSIQVTTD